MPRITTPESTSTVIKSISAANPKFVVKQSDACEFMLRLPGFTDSLRKRMPAIYEHSAIMQRYTCLEDYTRQPDQFEFFPKNSSMLPTPTTAARNAVYQRESALLAETASRNCIQEAQINPGDITHLIVVSCTGFFAPGLDILLVNQLGLPKNTRRTLIGFMGCYGAFNGLRTADAICRSFPGANVLLVCVELCTLHFQIENTMESVIVNALFSDGCAACVLSGIPADETAGQLIYRDADCLLDSDSLRAMSWSIGDTGFTMGLSPKVPELIARNLPEFADKLTKRSGISCSEISFWAVHPGGRMVLDRTQSVLQLPDALMADSYGILRDYGNMSSPTVLYILSRILHRQGVNRSGFGAALAFGPGLTIEGCLLEWGR